MTTGLSNPLREFSDSLADLVAEAGQSVVALNARRRRSASGILWRPDIVVTADHALGRDEEVTIALPDDRAVTGTFVGRDPGTDLAVLRIPESEGAAANVGDSQALKVGHFVLAVARSGDQGVSASMGVVSALGGGWRSWQGGRIDQFIRPSLMLYPGFSGSALVNAQGQVVGVNTAGPRHLALTIPAATVNRVVDYFLSGGRAVRGYLGLGMQSVQLPEALRTSLNLANRSGVIVVSVEPDAPAERAGVLIGDILVTLGGQLIEDVGDVHALLDPDRVGTSLTAQLIRGGSLTECAIVVGERPGREA